ncbi:MAG: class I SAM-dependent methyltransferase [Flavobacteriia bacterium]|nr:class I SAM-dependent methyltransferase [Flavobacteriia bacterium]
MKDLMGKAIWDYFHQNSPEDIITESSVSEQDVLPVSYLFRNFAEMPPIEQKALELSKGKVLDVGAAAGSHSLYLQNQKQLDVTAIDISEKSIEICKLRGVKNSVCQNLLDFNDGTFDTILLLMNGTGIFETIDRMDDYLKKLYQLLNPGGQLLIDGTDILYMFENPEGIELPADHYYGEVEYYVSYKGEEDKPFKMLYLDYDNLKTAAEEFGFKVEKVIEDEESYLARLTKI